MRRKVVALVRSPAGGMAFLDDLTFSGFDQMAGVDGEMQCRLLLSCVR